MVMADDEVVNVRHIFSMVNLSSLEEAVTDTKWCTRLKDRVNQVAHTVYLQEITRMPKPHDEVLRLIQQREVMTLYGDAILRSDILRASKDKSPQDL